MLLLTVSAVIPALDEERNTPHVFKRTPEDTYQMFRVDGRSVENMAEVARKICSHVCVVSQAGKGKGNALAFFNICSGRQYSDLCYGKDVFSRWHISALGHGATSSPDGRAHLREGLI
jgi:hypothetical protein